jgi:hypothetical protein
MAAGTTNSPATIDSKTAAFVKSHAGPTAWSVYAVGGGAAKATKIAVGDLSFGTAVGRDRFETAVKVADDGWPGTAAFGQPAVTTAGLANGYRYADALTGGAAMALADGPLLLTDPADGLSAEPAEFIGYKQAQLRNISVFGGTAVLPANVVTGVKKAMGTHIPSYVEHYLMF